MSLKGNIGINVKSDRPLKRLELSIRVAHSSSTIYYEDQLTEQFKELFVGMNFEKGQVFQITYHGKVLDVTIGQTESGMILRKATDIYWSIGFL